MYINVETGPAGRVSEFVRTLDRLKQTGCNLLMVGRVPDDVLAAACRKLLGDVVQRRFRLFVLTDADLAAVQERLAATEFQTQGAGANVPTPAANATAITYAGASRAPAAGAIDDIPEITRIDVDGDLAALATAIDEEIAAIERAADGLDPAQLRVCLDSLRPLLADYDTPEVGAFLEDVTDRVEAVGGMAHYVLPFERDHSAVAELAPQFDATIEYRAVEDGQERWHFPETDFTTEWLPLR